ncbi:uncharacterized protein LOC134321922 isoform X1 [Trichomycterus rosablanca]|uniref:uncharacterized protein LOC134312479 isoform X1 n=1 Tax=Trichomycterus rosablanca TaxID=2290929 RepID=UPI002F356396
MELSKILTDKAYRMVMEELQISESQSFTIFKEEEGYFVQWQGKGRHKKNKVDTAMKTCSCTFSVTFGLPCAHIIFCRKQENAPVVDHTSIHPRWLKRDEEVLQEFVKNGLGDCQVMMMRKSKFSSNERFSTVCPIAMEIASLIASCGGQEYQDKLQVLRNLLNSWKANKQSVVLEIASSTEDCSHSEDKQMFESGDSQTFLDINKTNDNVMSANKCSHIHDPEVAELDAKDAVNACSSLKITPVKSRRGRPKRQRNFTFNKKAKKRLHEPDTELDDLPSFLVPLQCQVMPTPDTGFSVGGITLYDLDLDTLKPGMWLNDNVIHAYLGLVAEESVKPVYILQCFIEGFWRKGQYTVWQYKHVQFEMYQWILLPVCRNSHWFLLAANVELRKVYVMDSQPSVTRQRQYLNYWRNFMKERAVTGEKLDGWSSGSISTVTQEDGSSCGIFALMNAEALIKNTDPSDVKQSQINKIRLYIRDRLIAAPKRN